MIDDINAACKVLQEGGVILYPTDTIWGIGCDATNEEAVKKVYAIKQRIDSKAMLILLNNPGKIGQYVNEMPDIAWDLIELAEKPITIIYSSAKNLAPNLLAEDGSIGIRITKEAFSEKLCERFRKPIVSTSANISEQASPRNFSEISPKIKEQVDFIVSYRQDDMSTPKPSGIIKLACDGTVKIIRE